MIPFLDSILQVAELVSKAVEIYHMIEDAPEKVRKLGDYMDTFGLLMRKIEVVVRGEKYKLQLLRKEEQGHLMSIVAKINSDCGQIAAIFERWRNKAAPFGLQWRWQVMAQVHFAMGSSVDRLQDLVGNVKEQKTLLMDYLAVCGLTKAIAGAAPTAGPGLRPSGPGRRSPSPLPRTDYRILFVDPSNLGRSVVAQGMAMLLREWTVQSGGTWRLATIHSAGFFVHNKSDLAFLISNMKYSRPSYRLEMKAGNAEPLPTPMAALFDNKLFERPFKDEIKMRLSMQRSRGLSENIFQYYDFIMVFTNRERENFVTLKKALVAKEGQGIAPAGKGRVLSLGRYPSTGEPHEILHPGNVHGDDEIRKSWNGTVTQIRTALRAFLREELKWQPPAEKPAQKPKPAQKTNEPSPKG